MKPIPLILDLDTGIDDAIALVYALGHPLAEVVAVGAVHGNVPAPIAAQNSLRILEMLRRADVPVAVGARRPLAQPLATAEFIHGSDGLGETQLPAPQGTPANEHAARQIVRLARQRPGELTLVATGPLTNLALALMAEPDLPRLLHQVVIMGGAAGCPGNITATAEANIWHDPEAADLVFQAGWPLRMVGLDVTMQVHMTTSKRLRLREMAADVPVAGWIDRMLDFYVRAYAGALGEGVCPVHDPLAMAAALQPEMLSYARWPVRVETSGRLTRGMTVAERRELGEQTEQLAPITAPLTEVAVGVDPDAFFHSFFASLANLGQSESGVAKSG